MLRSEGFRKYLANTSWMFVDRMVRLAAVFITAVYMARVLGDQLFGQLNYVSGFVGLFTMLTVMGLDEIVVRDLVRHPERRDELLGSAALLKLLGALVLAMLVFVGAHVNGMDRYTVLLAMVIAGAEVLKPFSVIEYHFLARVEGRPMAMANIAQTIASTLFKLVLCALVASPGLRTWLVEHGWGFADSVARRPLEWFAWAYVVDNVAFAVGFSLAYRRTGLPLRAWRATRRMMTHLLQQSWPLIIFGIAIIVHARIDQVMIFEVLKERIGEQAAYAEVGQYSVALKMIEALGFLPVIVQRSLAPAITRARVEDMGKYHDRLLNLYRLMFVLFLVTAVPLFLLAEPMITLLYGDTYSEAGGLLALFAIRLFFTNMGVAKTSWITNESLFKYSLLTAVVGAVVNIGLNYFLIPPFKAHGAIWSTIVSYMVSIFLLDLVSPGTRANLRRMTLGVATFWKLNSVR
jgi:O-antigen/teichoic acid export membrane protein